MDVENFRLTRTGLRLTGAALAVGLLASACSSSGNSGGSANSGAAGGAPASTTSSSSAAAGGSVTIEAHSGPMGTYLTDSAGKSLYMFASDSATKSSCSGTCLTYWPPLTTTGTVKGTGAASGGSFATITQSDGSKQVTYDGHPLYYFKLDSMAGDTNGQGSADFGAKWWLLAPSGKAITTTGSSKASSSSSSSGGGGGAWG